MALFPSREQLKITLKYVIDNDRVITLTPGSITIESLGSPTVLYVNVMHLHDVEDVRAELLRIEELAVRAFGSAIARAQLMEATAS